MTAEQQQRVRDLFEQAFDRSLDDARSWLAREAADDPQVESEVLSLLEHHSRAGAFLESPVAPRVAHLLEDDPRFDPGTVLGGYTIEREIGRGGMGRVYLATDSRLGRTVALKALPPSLTRDKEERERLRREARAAAALTHPGICTIYALEEIDEDVFIVSEFVEGRSLRDEIVAGVKPSLPVLVATATELADALASAHVKGITHRDLKPENIMRARDGRVKILDFGLALINPASAGMAAAPRMTEPGAIVGTPAYMAPEQLRGEQADARTDVFAFGVLIYEYASGVHPFDAETALGRAARVLESEPRPLQALRRDIPASLMSVIERCLRKAPADRFFSAAAIAPVLSRVEAPGEGGVTAWWRTHQLAAVALYAVASSLAWMIKEWQHGVPDVMFLLVGPAAAIGAVFRGHLLFTERVNRGAFDGERRRADTVTLAIDVLIGLALAVDGWSISDRRPLVAVLTFAFAAGLALARLVLERATARGAFGESVE